MSLIAVLKWRRTHDRIHRAGVGLRVRRPPDDSINIAFGHLRELPLGLAVPLVRMLRGAGGGSAALLARMLGRARIQPAGAGRDLCVGRGAYDCGDVALPHLTELADRSPIAC